MTPGTEGTTKAADPAPRLELRRLSVDFGATRALAGVDVAIPPGQIVGLLGHNGAGKTTLFNVVSGVITATRGSFHIDGEPVGAGISPRRAAELGITVIHQEPALAPNLSVLDNLVLGRVNRGRSRREVVAAAREALGRVGAEVALDAPVGSLDLGQRQLVDLARGLLAGEMRILLLDEPTAALGRKETDYLHGLIRKLAGGGVTVVYISHRLPDILEVCERVLVLRGGELVEDGAAASFTPSRLASALVPDLKGHDFRVADLGPVTLSFDDPFEMSFRSGEVVGLFGMAAGEQFALVNAVAGVGGRFQLTLDGCRTTVASPADAIGKGFFLVPADRDTEGLVGAQSALVNVMLPWLGRSRTGRWWVTDRSGIEVYRKARAELAITGPEHTAEVSQFSGGNRQKHLLARWIYPVLPKVLLLAQPTQGVDVGAKVDIVRVVRKAAADGATVLVASAESDEIATMCDRSYVLANGRVAEVPRSDGFDRALLTKLLSLAARAATASHRPLPTSGSHQP